MYRSSPADSPLTPTEFPEQTLAPLHLGRFLLYRLINRHALDILGDDHVPVIRFEAQGFILCRPGCMSQTGDDGPVPCAITPIRVQTSLDETFRRRIDLADVGMRGQGEQNQPDLRVFIWFRFELRVRQEWVQNSQVGVTALSTWTRV